MIVVIGDLLVDVLVRHAEPLAHGSDTPARTVLSPGGAGGNVAAWLAHAGAAVRMVGCVGDDALADVALRGLERDAAAHRADGPAGRVGRPARGAGGAGDGGRVADGVRRVGGVATGTCVVLVGPDAERTMLPDPGANAALVASDVPELRAGDVLYVSGYTLLREATRPAALHALDAARAVGARTVLDPASAAPLAAAPGVIAAAGPVDLLLPNAAEAAVLGAAGLDGAREVVVTAGADGATWNGPRDAAGRDHVHVPAAAGREARHGTDAAAGRDADAPAAREARHGTDAATGRDADAGTRGVVDTTGAGDAFAAGFVAAWAGGAAPEIALRAGAALAADVVSRPGARPGT